jgi:hypothetical protein
MGNETILQFQAAEDGCVYFYDRKRGTYRKICDVDSFNSLPVSVKRQIKAAKAEALETIALPVE